MEWDSGEGWDKERRKVKRKMIFRKNEKNSNRNSKFKLLFEFFI